MKKSLLLKSLLLLCVLMAGVNGVKAEDTVNTKWKKTAVADLTSGDVVAIVDLTNAVAMSNDKGTSKAPGAVSVTLNDSKSRITDEEVGDSCQVAINIGADGTTLTFNVPEGKNIIKLGNAMDGFMEMFGSFMNKEDEEGAGGEEGGEEEESPMSSMDISMPSFNVFDDEDTKAVLPKLYQYVPGDEYDIYIDRTHWTTVVSDYDVTLPEEEENKLAAYIVTGVSLVDNVYESCLVLEEVESIKAGVAYLVTGVNRDGTFTLKRAVEQSAPAPKKSSVKDADLESNLLKVSGHDTADGAYLLGTDDEVVGMVRWNQGVTGSGHAYLPADEVADGRPFVPIKKTSSIEGVTVDETNTNSGCYDLWGREVKGKPQPGIYILNGRKVIIK